MRVDDELRLLTVVIPARDEEGAMYPRHGGASRSRSLRLNRVPHEIVVVNDGSTDRTGAGFFAETAPGHTGAASAGEHWPARLPGRAIIHGLEHMRGDAVVIMMADESDDCRDVVRYWQILNQGWDAVFGSRFVKGGGVIDYPPFKLFLNRLFNGMIRLLFNIKLNDTTNAFKAYRRTVIEGCRPLLSPHFNLTVELPLKTIVRGYSWAVIPITWRNRRTGEAKLKLKEMGSRYFFICLYVWLEKYFSRGDYRKRP